MRTGFSLDEMRSVECEVIIVCSVYNQEDVVKDALEGFVKQKTSFPFVALVHDDASTDSTAQIVMEYAERYPSIIKGIYDSENQYQQNKLFWYLDFLRESKAHFIAICEGDDYWIEDEKLEKQYQQLIRNPNCSFCFTNAVKIDYTSGRLLGVMLPAYSWEKRILKKGKLDTVDLLRITFLPTATFFARKDAWLLEPILPDKAFKGDRAHQIFLSLHGDACYIDAVTSVYRVNNTSSLMGNWAESSSKMVSVLDSYIELYKFFDTYSEFSFHNAVQDAIDLKLFDKMLLTSEKELLSSKSAYKIAARRGLPGILKCFLFQLSPAIYHFIRNVGRFIRPREQ